jgi:hypothetical protein
MGRGGHDEEVAGAAPSGNQSTKWCDTGALGELVESPGDLCGDPTSAPVRVVVDHQALAAGAVVGQLVKENEL